MTPMNPVWGIVAGVFIVLMMVTFIGIWIWAWRSHHQRVFKRMAALPMEDDIDGSGTDIHADTREDRR